MKIDLFMTKERRDLYIPLPCQGNCKNSTHMRILKHRGLISLDKNLQIGNGNLNLANNWCDIWIIKTSWRCVDFTDKWDRWVTCIFTLLWTILWEHKPWIDLKCSDYGLGTTQVKLSISWRFILLWPKSMASILVLQTKQYSQKMN